MKRIFLCATLFAPLACFASGGQIDGGYQCAVGARTAYIAVVGYPDGRSAFGVVATEVGQSLIGYGLGNVNGATFSGTTDGGGTFNMTIAGTTLAGAVQLRLNGVMTTVNATCSKIY